MQVVHLPEARLAQEIHRPSGTLAGLAMNYNLAGGIEFVNATGQLAKGHQMPFEIANLVFVRFAHIQNENVIALVQAFFQIARRNLGNVQIGFRLLFTANAAELIVVDELVDLTMSPAHRAMGVLSQFEFAKFEA